MKRKYAEIMDRVKVSNSMRSEVLMNVLSASQKEAQDKTPREKHDAARRMPHRGARRGIVAAICAGAAAAACLVAVPAIDASWSVRRGPDRVTIVSSVTVDSAAENHAKRPEEEVPAFGGTVQGTVPGTAKSETIAPKTQEPARPDSEKPVVAEGGLSAITEVLPPTKRPVQITTAQTGEGQAVPQPVQTDGGLEGITAGGGDVTAEATGPTEGFESVDGAAPMPPAATAHPATGPAHEGVVPPDGGGDLLTMGPNPSPEDTPSPGVTESPAETQSPEPSESYPGGQDAGADVTDTETTRDPNPVSEPNPGPDPDGTAHEQAESFSENPE